MGAEGGDIDGITVGLVRLNNLSIDAGNGGRVTGVLPVTAGETLYIYVGGEGSDRFKIYLMVVEMPQHAVELK